MKLNKDVFYFIFDYRNIDKLYLSCLLLYMLQFALERQVNVESNIRSYLVTFQFRGLFV